MRSFVRWGVSLAALFAAGCAQNLVQVRETPAGANQALAIKRVAVAPFHAAPRPGAPTLRSDASSLVASYVAEGFGTRGIDVVPSSDVAQALGGTEDLRGALAVAHDKFGADALVTGTVYRFRDRSGEAYGTMQPASTGFEVKVYGSDTGKLLWSAVFDHTQVALGVNALTATQYPGGGTRWLTVEELARWGAIKVVDEMPVQ